MISLVAKRVTDTIWCLIVDDCPIGTATWRNGSVNATVIYDGEIEHFGNHESLFCDMLSEIVAHIRKVEAHWDSEAEYHDEAIITHTEHAERKSKDGRMFIGDWELK